MNYNLVVWLTIFLVVAVWLVRHPLVLSALNLVPLAWLTFGGPGVIAATLLLLPAVVVFQRRHPLV